MNPKRSSHRKGGDWEREVASDGRDHGCIEGEGRVKRLDYGESLPDVLVGFKRPDGQLVMLVIECKARAEGYPATVKGWHAQNAGYIESIAGIPINAVAVTNLPGRGGKKEPFISLPYREFWELIDMIPKQGGDDER